MTTKRFITEARAFTRSGSLDPIEKVMTAKHGRAVATWQENPVNTNFYTYSLQLGFPEFVTVDVIAVGLQMMIKWQTGPDPINRWLMFRGGQNIRNATVQPNAFDYTAYLGADVDFNGYNLDISGGGFPVTMVLTNSNKRLTLVPQDVLTLPVPFTVKGGTDVGTGIIIEGTLNTSDLYQIAATQIFMSYTVDIWFKGQR